MAEVVEPPSTSLELVPEVALEVLEVPEALEEVVESSLVEVALEVATEVAMEVALVGVELVMVGLEPELEVEVKDMLVNSLDRVSNI